MKDNNKIGGKGGKRRRRKQSSKTIWKTSCCPLIRPCGLITDNIQSKYVFTPLKIVIVSASITINAISSANSKIRVLAAAPFRVWLECRKIQRKGPPRFARRPARIIYRQCNKSRQRAVSVEKIDTVPFPLIRKLASWRPLAFELYCNAAKLSANGPLASLVGPGA